jgi:hypothetical protein
MLWAHVQETWLTRRRAIWLLSLLAFRISIYGAGNNKLFAFSLHGAHVA